MERAQCPERTPRSGFQVEYQQTTRSAQACHSVVDHGQSQWWHRPESIQQISARFAPRLGKRLVRPEQSVQNAWLF